MLLKRILLSLLSKKNILVIFPGFGILPRDYNPVIPNTHEPIYLDLWPDSELDYIVKNVRAPGTMEYSNWYTQKINECVYKLNKELINNHKNAKKLVFFGHSFGGEMAFHVANRELAFNPELYVITYGGKYPKNNVTSDHVVLLGTKDNLIKKYNSKWPEGVVVLENGTHFSPVNDEGFERSLRWANRIKLDHGKQEREETLINTRQQIQNYITQALA